MRNYKRKTQRANTSKDQMERAMREVLLEKKPCRSVAKEFNIPHVTLRRYCLNFKKENGEVSAPAAIVIKTYGYYNNRIIFTKDC